MTFTIEKPNIEGKSPEEAIAALDTWAARLTDELNYILNHLDRDNILEDMTTHKYVDDRCRETYEDIRKYIISQGGS